MVSLGRYPEVPLSLARDRALAARRQWEAGIAPADAKRAEREARSDTFEAIASEWLAKQPFAAITKAKAEWILGDLLYPHIGNKPIGTLKAPEVLSALRRIEHRGLHETAFRAKQRVSQVMRYAIATGRAERDVAADLKGALTPVVSKNHASIVDPVRVGELLRAIDGYDGQPATHAALKLAPLVFVRPGELRAAEWSEFDLDTSEWRIPAARMKMGTQHIVPLSTQAVAILKELQPLTGRGTLTFPSIRSSARPLSDNTLNAALRRLGFTTEEMTSHGFRSMASTLLNEQGWHPDLIELQLAHAERNKVRAAYNKAQRLPERRKMMQAWADYLDGLKAGGNVVTLKKQA
jgi:integrase